MEISSRSGGFAIDIAEPTTMHSCHLCQQEPDGKPGWVQDYKWAVCPRCILKGRALVGDVSKQNYGIGGPIRAYWDQQRQCQYCGRDYLFTAQEQQFWYEEQNFTTQSAPIGCIVCRKEVRDRVRANQELAALGKPQRGCSWQGLEKRAELAFAAGSSGKALEYLRRAKNACAEPEHKDRLSLRVKEWTEKPPAPLERKFRRVTRQVEQLELHYNLEELPLLSWEERQKGLAQLALPPEQTRPVARFNGSRLEVLGDSSAPDTWAWRYSDGTLRPWAGSGAKVTIDPDTGVILWLPGSGSSGRTGFFERDGTVYGPDGPLPWLPS